MADERQSNTNPALAEGFAELAERLGAALRRVADAIGMGSGISLCEDVPEAVEKLAAAHEGLKRELERRPQNEAGAMAQPPTEALVEQERCRRRDQERRRLWVHVVEKALDEFANGHGEAEFSESHGKTAVRVADDVLAGFDAAFPGKP